MTDVRDLLVAWRHRADVFATHGAGQTATTIKALAAELESAIRAEDEQPLTLREGSAASGFSVDHLGRLVREGKIRNVGRKFAPRILRVDLPTRPGHHRQVASVDRTEYDPAADARSLRERRLQRGGAHGTT
ncbi:MAG TPA: hypothetical protein VNW46_16680 [Gemmatimonadaceae bacterium]|jgi:hypothetical protein|nr:hypothetical protein [Gemmatimonadaceae bacterium]